MYVRNVDMYVRLHMLCVCLHVCMYFSLAVCIYLCL